MGVPDEAVGSLDEAGAVNVLYGGPDGLSAEQAQLLTGNSDGLPGSATAGHRMGATLAVGDFDDDGRDDLAIGAPFGGSVVGVGAVFVMYGGFDGLSSWGSQRWRFEDLAGPDGVWNGDRMGETLAVGDFDGDDRDDLAIGLPGWQQGRVVVLFGSGAGLSAFGSQDFGQSDVSPPGTDVRDGFGFGLAAGEINGDAYADLVVANPNDPASEDGLYGRYSILPGSAAGVVTLPAEVQSVVGLASERQSERIPMAVGNPTGTGSPVPILGLPYHDGGGLEDTGMVTSGAAYPELRFEQPFPNEGDRFGHALVVDDFDFDGASDMFVGSPENLGGYLGWLPGGPQGWQEEAFENWRVFNSWAFTDDMGAAIAAGDFDGDTSLDLAVGDPAHLTGEGRVAILRGTGAIVFADGFETGSLFFWTDP